MAEVTPIEKVTFKQIRDFKNYTTWLICIKQLLNRDGLLDHISDAPEFPISPPESQEYVNSYKYKDLLDHYDIGRNLSNEAAANLTGEFIENALAKIVCNRLKETYKKENLQAVLNIQGKLFKLKFNKGEDVEKNFKSFEYCFVQLASLGSTIANQETQDVFCDP